jgi:thiol:disulfide interchange protein DsbC
MLGPSIIYVSGDGRYIVKGDIFDLSTLDNITGARRAAARVDAFASLGYDDMIEFAPKNGEVKRTLYVYTDIDCGYCRKMHQEVGLLNDAGIAVRYLAYPRSGIGGESYKKAVSVWCAADRPQALTASKAGQKIENAECPNPVTKFYHMGEAMGVRGTPAVYSDDGESLGGYVPAPELIRLLLSTEG